MASDRSFSKAELDQQFDDWLASQTLPTVDDASVRDAVRRDLEFVRNMPVEEYTLWRNWNSIQKEFPGTVINTLRGRKSVARKSEANRALKRVEGMIWRPSDPSDYLKLEPELYYVKDRVPIPSVDIWGNVRVEEYTNPDPLEEDWRFLRHFTSSAEYGGTVGRSLNYLVRDKVSQRYLGVICISSDFMEMKPRDNSVGWTHQQRTYSGKLKHTANGSTIVPTQPFGHDYLGGKLCALLCLSTEVQNKWRERYGDVLVGMTTTALYGKKKGATQYDQLRPYWKRLGHSTGSVALRPTPENEDLLKEWLRARFPRQYWENFVAQGRDGMPLKRDYINRAYQFAYRKLGIKPDEFVSHHDRVVYFARIYENTDAFLRGEIKKSELSPLANAQTKQPLDFSTEALTDLWRNKHASKQVDKLTSTGGFKNNTLFYRGMIGRSWEDAKSMFP